MKHSAKCPGSDCDGVVSVDIEDWSWSACSKCGANLSKELRFRYQETYEMVREVVDENGGDYQCAYERVNFRSFIFAVDM